MEDQGLTLVETDQRDLRGISRQSDFSASGLTLSEKVQPQFKELITIKIQNQVRDERD